MARITPRITPFVPKPQYYTPGHLLRGAIRGVATGNVPHPRIAIPHVRIPGGSTSALMQQTHSGTKSPGTLTKPPKTTRPPQVRAPRPIRITGSRPAGTVKVPTSMTHQRPGLGPIIPSPAAKKRQIKSVIGRSNPVKIKFPNI